MLVIIPVVHIKTAIAYLVIITCCTVIGILFSETIYWYVPSVLTATNLFFYAFAMAAALWAMAFFRVYHRAPLFLCAALYGFLAEGVIVGLIYTDGPLGLFFVSYTALAWHAPLSIMFGLYYVRLWLVNGSVKNLIVWMTLYGVFWGSWWLHWIWETPESAGEDPARAYVLTPSEFFWYALLVTAALAAAHALLGYVWRSDFKITAPFAWLLWVAIAVGFFFNIAVAIPWAPLKLGVLLTIIFFALWRYRRLGVYSNIFSELSGKIRVRHLLLLFCLPIAAGATYSLGFMLPDKRAIDALTLGYIGLQTILGGFFFIGAFYRTLRLRVPHYKTM